jgi:hypothetical protein
MDPVFLRIQMLENKSSAAARDIVFCGAPAIDYEYVTLLYRYHSSISPSEESWVGLSLQPYFEGGFHEC